MKKDEKDELPQLTEKQYNFVMGIQKGLSKTEAYKQAYETKRMADRTIWAEASRTAANPDIAAWCEYAKREAARKLVDESTYTLKAHMDELNETYEFAKEQKSVGPMVKCVELKGKACNHYTEHKEINVNNAADLALLEQLERMLGADAMLSAARQMGYSLDEIKPTEH